MKSAMLIGLLLIYVFVLFCGDKKENTSNAKSIDSNSKENVTKSEQNPSKEDIEENIKKLPKEMQGIARINQKILDEIPASKLQDLQTKFSPVNIKVQQLISEGKTDEAKKLLAESSPILEEVGVKKETIKEFESTMNKYIDEMLPEVKQLMTVNTKITEEIPADKLSDFQAKIAPLNAKIQKMISNKDKEGLLDTQKEISKILKDYNVKDETINAAEKAVTDYYRIMSK